MKKGVIFIFLVLLTLFLASFVYAEQVIIKLEFYIHKNDTIDMLNVTTGTGVPDQISDVPEDYLVGIIDGKNEIQYANYFTPYPKRRNRPPMKYDGAWVNKNLPYTTNNGSIVIFINKLPKFFLDLAAFCNNDGSCNNLESYLTCNDCPAAEDEVCLVVNDTICDPDCKGGEDNFDCAVKEDKGANIGYIIPVLVVVLLLAAVILFFKRKK